MKIIHNINLYSYLITIILYATIIFGLYAQIALGGIQILLAIFLLFQWKNLDSKTTNLLKIYWFIVFCYAALLFLLLEGHFDHGWIWLATIVIIPMSIASYFIYLTRQLKNSNSNPIKQ